VQPALKRRILKWPHMSHGPSPASGPPADTSIPRLSSVGSPYISGSGEFVNRTSVPTSGEWFTTPENGSDVGEDGNHQPRTSQWPLNNMLQHPPASRAPPNPPSLPKPRRGIDRHSFTLTPIPQGDGLRALAPSEEPRSFKDKVTTAATIIGRPFTKAEMNWVMATLWPDTVDYLGKGQKKNGQAVRSTNL